MHDPLVDVNLAPIVVAGIATGVGAGVVGAGVGGTKENTKSIGN